MNVLRVSLKPACEAQFRWQPEVGDTADTTVITATERKPLICILYNTVSSRWPTWKTCTCVLLVLLDIGGITDRSATTC